ncbi:MAG: bifunctional nicotinamidase/pyrazinamidase [Spirochaetaceae bacterium]|jgi:nicotinamidase/pyrazinamidase|nr:bifunctional nicotinamidase/pyrazinamidase [Spirochaetaceae bacterium]
MTINFERSALIEIDVQNDFCPGGALAVADGDKVVAPLNEAASRFAAARAPVVATQDWHPAGHCSFASAEAAGKWRAEGEVLWPDHCVQGTAGADFHPALDLRPVTLVVRKGFRPHVDSYSAFFENDRKTPTGLAAYLRELGVDTVYLGGLATDYCVYFSALDAVKLRFNTYLLSGAVRGVNYPEGSTEKALLSMKNSGVLLVNDR